MGSPAESYAPAMAFAATKPRIHSRITDPMTAVNKVNHQPPATVLNRS